MTRGIFLEEEDLQCDFCNLLVYKLYNIKIKGRFFYVCVNCLVVLIFIHEKDLDKIFIEGIEYKR